MAEERIIPQRELRNNVGEILREAEAGAEFTITVRGRAVARLGPAEAGRRVTNVPADLLRKKLAGTPVDDRFATDIQRLRQAEAPVDDPLPNP
jgi:prevent-host-death family protein